MWHGFRLASGDVDRDLMRRHGSSAFGAADKPGKDIIVLLAGFAIHTEVPLHGIKSFLINQRFAVMIVLAIFTEVDLPLEDFADRAGCPDDTIFFPEHEHGLSEILVVKVMIKQGTDDRCLFAGNQMLTLDPVAEGHSSGDHFSVFDLVGKDGQNTL